MKLTPLSAHTRAAVEAAGHRKWRIVEEFVDNGISGAKGRDKRPGFDRLLKAVVRREIDVVAVWSVDRLGRSLQHLVGLLEELDGAGCDLYLHQQATLLHGLVFGGRGVAGIGGRPGS
jgi:DNA invertase Pin-like site-specific DNA recombinase